MAKNRKSKLDKFYTKRNISKLCIDITNTHDFDTIIEPSAGDGSFSDQIPDIIAFDIDPDKKYITKQDYLLLNISKYINGSVLIIGNPPFGNNSSLIFKFFNKSTFADRIAFILPKSFKKPSFQDRIPLNFHLIRSIDLPDNSFILNDKEYNVPCVFQIWDKKNFYRQKSIKLSPKSFIFVKKDENPDLSIRRVGVNTGKLFLDSNRSKSSHYFIKCNNINNFITKYNNIIFEHNNTSGCNSISKQEIIKNIDYS